VSLQADSENNQLSKAFKWKYLIRNVCFVLAMGLQIFIYHMANERYFVVTEQLNTFQDKPGDVLPWYFIRRDFLHGICHGMALLITLMAALVVVRWFPESALWLAFSSLIWLGGGIWKSAVIMASCTDLMDPVKATTHWQNFDQYLYDPTISYGHFIVTAVPVLLIFYFRPILKRLDYRKRITDEIQSNVVPANSVC